MKKSHIAVAVALLLAVPALAVFNERDLGQTIHSLRLELKRDYEKRLAAEQRFASQYKGQRRDMVAIMKKCNELSLILYSQKQDYTFDLTYALESVSREYEDFQSKRLPYDQIVNRLDWDIDRYARLVESLRRIPPEMEEIKDIPDSLRYHNDSLDFAPARQRRRAAGTTRFRRAEVADSLGSDRPFLLDGQETEDRDSCIFYAAELLKMSAANRQRIVTDSTHYQRSYLRLKESYDYAQQRYRLLQNRIFIQGQTPYNKIVAAFPRYWNRAMQDWSEKYVFDRRKTEAAQGGQNDVVMSRWSGSALIMFIATQIEILLALLLLALLLIKLAARYIKPLAKLLPGEYHFSFALLFALVVSAILTFSPRVSSTSGFMESAASLTRTYLWLISIIVLSMLIRIDRKKLRNGMLLYAPVMLMAILVISVRVIFMPNSLMNIIFPPLLLVFFFWQLTACLKHDKQAAGMDRLLGWMSLLVTGVAFGVAAFGYIFVALLIMLWWFFITAIMLTIITFSDLLEKFRVKYLDKHIKDYKKSLTFVNAAERDNLTFGATWFYDLVKDVLLPVAALISLPLSLKLALNVFDFSELFEKLFNSPFIHLANADGVSTLKISFRIIVVGAALFFLFRYLNKALYSLYQIVRYNSFMRKTGRSFVRKDEINFSLGKSIINTLLWFTYIIILIVMLKIPTNSLTIIAGGLSAGIGIALKDVLNNFIYGIQLMSGRLRVGEWIECDGIRGRVTSISYQCTEIETIENTLMSFPNAMLFNKNFSNLTHNNAYEFLKITVGVSYGSDIEKVRSVLLEALEVLRTKDVYGREIVDPKKGFNVTFSSFDDSAVTVAVKQYVLVPEKIAYADKAKEVIYNALNEAGIPIPFPQRDVHIISE